MNFGSWDWFLKIRKSFFVTGPASSDNWAIDGLLSKAMAAA
jgi:hypothetical protein